MTTKLPLRPNVCMLLYNSEGKLFLGERDRSPGHWQFPQGGAEPDLSLEENVIRELKEELGVKRKQLGKLIRLDTTFEYEWDSVPGYARGKWRGQSQTFWVVQFVGCDSDIRLDADREPEFMSWRWSDVAEVRRLAAPRRLTGYEPALKEFELLWSKRGLDPR